MLVHVAAWSATTGAGRAAIHVCQCVLRHVWYSSASLRHYPVSVSGYLGASGSRSVLGVLLTRGAAESPHGQRGQERSQTSKCTFVYGTPTHAPASRAMQRARARARVYSMRKTADTIQLYIRDGVCRVRLCECVGRTVCGARIHTIFESTSTR